MVETGERVFAGREECPGRKGGLGGSGHGGVVVFGWGGLGVEELLCFLFFFLIIYFMLFIFFYFFLN